MMLHHQNRGQFVRLGSLACATFRGVALFWCALALGCVADRGVVDRNLIASRQIGSRDNLITEQYQVGCPDVLEIAIQRRPEFDGHYTVQPDGRINVGRYGRLRVDGHDLGSLGRRLAEEVGVAPEAVRVRVVEFRSKQLVLFGEVVGWQRTVAYQGPETVLDLLQRVGGLTSGAAVHDVHVVRAHLGDGGRPEVFHLDLDAIILRQDQRTNVRLVPFDQIYVGETRQATIEKCVPPWLRPAYEKFWNLLPRENAPLEGEAKRSHWVAAEKK